MKQIFPLLLLTFSISCGQDNKDRSSDSPQEPAMRVIEIASNGKEAVFLTPGSQDGHKDLMHYDYAQEALITLVDEIPGFIADLSLSKESRVAAFRQSTADEETLVVYDLPSQQKKTIKLEENFEGFSANDEQLLLHYNDRLELLNLKTFAAVGTFSFDILERTYNAKLLQFGEIVFAADHQLFKILAGEPDYEVIPNSYYDLLLYDIVPIEFGNNSFLTMEHELIATSGYTYKLWDSSRSQTFHLGGGFAHLDNFESANLHIAFQIDGEVTVTNRFASHKSAVIAEGNTLVPLWDEERHDFLLIDSMNFHEKRLANFKREDYPRLLN